MKKKKTPKQARVEMMLPRRIKWFNENGRFKRSVTIRPYRIGELAKLYGTSTHIVKKWLASLTDQLGPYINRCYSAQQVEIIFRELGVPGWMLVKVKSKVLDINRKPGE